MRSVFVDCGANLGQVLAGFIARFPASDFYAFEPNKQLLPSIRKHVAATGHGRVEISERAVWTHDGSVDLFLGHHESSTVMPGKRVPPMYSQQIDYTRPIAVPCLDFSAWVGRTFEPADHVTAKMDIEGAEYPVLRKMLDDDTLRLLSILYVEWHHDRFDYISRRTHRNLEAAVSAQVEVRPWD